MEQETQVCARRWFLYCLTSLLAETEKTVHLMEYISQKLKGILW